MTNSAASVQDCREEQSMDTNNKLTILYCRLSKDDNDGEKESNSIGHQREMLIKFAENSGLVPYSVVIEAAVIIEPTRKPSKIKGFGVWFFLL